MRLSSIVWNAGGLLVPLCVAVLTVPALVERLGQERFGLLALAWGLIGYAGAMDLGIGRALTQAVARLRGEGDLQPIPDTLVTAGRLTFLAGVVAGLLIATAALLGGSEWIKVETTPSREIRDAMVLLALALPAQAMTATYRGMNEAFLNFREISALRCVLGIVNFGGPYFVASYTTELPWLVSTLVVSRLAGLFAFRYLARSCAKGIEHTTRRGRYSHAIAKSLFSFGAWVTVSNIVSPLLVQADRFVIGSVVSVAAVATYVLPYEVVVQALVLAGAISSVMFPGLSQMIREKPDEWRPYFNKWLLRVIGVMALVCLSNFLLLPFVFRAWIEIESSGDAIEIGRILCAGVFANSIGSMFYALLHAKGRADITAKLHLIELPLFVVALSWLVIDFGVKGAAWAWAARMVLDALMLAWMGKAARA